jgi:hypothetical protein
MRSISAVVVRLRCSKCRRVVGRLYGTVDEPISFDTTRLHGLLPRAGRIEYFRCRPRCHPDRYLIRWERLVDAYRGVVELPPRERVLWLPLVGQRV